MLGIIPTATVLDMLTPDDDETPDALYVRDVLDHKRRSEHYAELLEEIRRDGIALPVMVRTYRDQPWLVDGHHRIAAAIDLGISHVIWSDLPGGVGGPPQQPDDARLGTLPARRLTTTLTTQEGHRCTAP